MTATLDPLPEITDYVIAGVAEWLRSNEPMQRRPDATAKVLVLAVLLHRTRTPWPIRKAVAEHLGVSVGLVDMVLSQRQATEHIHIVTDTKAGSVAKRPSVRKDHYVVPCDALIQAVSTAEREERNAKRRAKTTTTAAR